MLLVSSSASLAAPHNEPEPKTTPAYTLEYINPEQQQLEWCFIYSNMLGFQIDYVANPRLFEQIGKWAGTRTANADNNRSNADCAGLVSHIYRQVYGKNLSGNAKDIYKQVRSIRKDELREGDLVFLSSESSRISEVGIFLGNNKFAHSSPQGGLMVSDLDEKQFADRFEDGGRP